MCVSEREGDACAAFPFSRYARRCARVLLYDSHLVFAPIVLPLLFSLCSTLLHFDSALLTFTSYPAPRRENTAYERTERGGAFGDR